MPTPYRTRFPIHHRVALLALCAAAPWPAAAQSSVSISGIMDLAVRSVSNEGVGSMKSMVSGSNSTSRIIISGREDLGDGLSAGFHLEHGILADTGGTAVGNKFWDRRSTVSIASKTLGELRLGRDFVPSYTNWSRYDPFAYVGVGRAPPTWSRPRRRGRSAPPSAAMPTPRCGRTTRCSCCCRPTRRAWPAWRAG